MPSKFVRLMGDDIDVVINLELVTQVERNSNFVTVWYMGDNESLKLAGDSAESFWRCIVSNSLCIHRKQHTLAENAQSSAVENPK